MQTFRALCLLLLGAVSTAAQQPASPSKPIQDNSFLLEEAYNQETGVVQHINFFTRQRGGHWLYTFTQEWPVPTQKHQLSLTLPVQQLDQATGLGDIALNYRYQLVGSGETKLAIAPRISLLFPTGNSDDELGAGGLGIQFNLPVSVTLHDKLVTHWNAGATVTPSAKNAAGIEDNRADFNLGQSFIWLAHQNFNVMFETVWNNTETILARGVKDRENSVLMSPGIRWAHNFKSGLQIVPGIAVPFGIGPSYGEKGILFYLSFEHPFTKQ